MKTETKNKAILGELIITIMQIYKSNIDSLTPYEIISLINSKVYYAKIRIERHRI
jgi:hypothetical protein